jgi:hypothetical protein
MGGDDQPLACSLADTERAERERRLRALSDGSLVDRSRDGDELELRFRCGDDVRTSVEELVELESRCCPFLDFMLREEPGQLVLRVAGPEGARGVIDAFDSALGDPKSQI